MEDSGVLLSLILLTFLIFLNAFFAMSELAIISINTNKMKKRAEEGNKKAKLLLKIIDSPSDFLATIQVGVTLSGFLASAVAAEKFVGILTGYFSFLPLKPDLLGGIILIVITLILSYFTLIFGELVPKRIAMKFPDKIALAIIKIVWFFYLISRPFVIFLAASTNAVLKLFGLNGEDEEEVTEEEILLLVEEGEEKGFIEHRERDMIKNIFEFDDKKVSEVMTHRTDIVAVAIDTSLKDIIKIIDEEGYSRIPVYKDSLDNIIGVLYIKDLLPLLTQESCGENKNIEEYLRQIPFVPETKQCGMLLKQFQEEKIHIAIVVDEHGGTEGLVTMEDLLEVIVGDIEDEHDEEEEEIVALSNGLFVFDAATPVEDVEEYFDCNVFSGDDYDTIGGFMIEELGYIPKKGEKVLAGKGEYILTVLEADSRRILKIQVERKSSITENDGHKDNQSA